MPAPARSPRSAAAAVAAAALCCCSLTATGEGAASADAPPAGTSSARGSGTGSAPAVQVVLEPGAEARYSRLPPAPAPSVGRITGAVATWALVAAAVLTLTMRLSIGWPRFPPRYRGRRRTRP